MESQPKTSAPPLTSIITSTSHYPRVLSSLQKLSESEKKGHLRNLCTNDLYFLLRYGLKRADIDHPWLFDRCREVQANPNGYLDLWAREHYKSTIITFAKTIQDILNDPDITVGIFSHTRPIAKKFLRQIKREFEANALLKELFPDILWTDPNKESPKWSEDDGIIVRRKSNPGESTVEAWGLVDGQPTGKHFRLLIYDDVVTDKSVTTPEMIEKTTDALSLSYNLGANGGNVRFIGTRYHFNDTYKTVIDRGTAIPRVYPATVDGTVNGQAVLLPQESLAKKRRDQGPYTFGCQMLQSPTADETQGFKSDWINFADSGDGFGMNKYILVDPANEKKKSSDYTVMWVIGLGQDNNYYHLEVVRDRLNLTQRTDQLIRLHRKWQPQGVGYEKYGMQADIEHIKHVQKQYNYRFHITELGGSTPKLDRIRRLIPVFEQGRFYLKHSEYKTNYEGKTVDLVESFINEEYLPFPVAIHDDMIDALARILDPELNTVWPEQSADDDYEEQDNTGRSAIGGY